KHFLVAPNRDPGRRAPRSFGLGTSTACEAPAAGDVVLVAERDGSIAGFAAATRVHPFEYAKPQLRVSAIAVASDARRSGIGAALARALEARAEAMGCFRVELTSAHALVGAHAFWRSVGYRDAGRRFVRALEDEALTP
ncbi:MAG TPA: hypothetical protein DEF51_07565, partial [Myxococcales bacterium]|nr:hypothetical protein [Myxococcales bacterium]